MSSSGRRAGAGTGREARDRREGESLARLAREVVACAACPRLRRYCEEVAARRKPEFAGWTYWGRPVPGFGDPRARVLVVGLAPAAHGANRTGRMFTGDSSGHWLVRALYRAGFSTQPTSVHRRDGLRLREAYVTAVVRCAPPQNRPTPAEIARCLPFLERELALLPHVEVIVALGRVAFDACRALLRRRGARVQGLRFAHGAAYRLGPGLPVLVASYHPSRQNTNTGKLTEAMLDRVFQRVRDVLERGRPAARAREKTR